MRLHYSAGGVGASILASHESTTVEQLLALANEASGQSPRMGVQVGVTAGHDDGEEDTFAPLRVKHGTLEAGIERHL